MTVILLAVCRQFQSTLSMRRATKASSLSTFVICISIHALHEESDHGLSIP